MRQIIVLTALSIMLLCGSSSEAGAWCERDCIKNCEKRVGTTAAERDTCVNTTAACHRFRGQKCYGYPERNPLESVVGPKARRPYWVQ
jgi:hypothetical protein